MVYSRTKARLILDEIEELSLLHHDEVKDFYDDKLQIDFKTYIEYEDSMAIYEAREMGSNKLVGYASFFLFGNHHYGNRMDANQDAFFLHKDFRGHGKFFLAFIDNDLKELGVNYTYQHVKPRHDWSKILINQNYTYIEKIYAKKL